MAAGQEHLTDYTSKPMTSMTRPLSNDSTVEYVRRDNIDTAENPHRSSPSGGQA